MRISTHNYMLSGREPQRRHTQTARATCSSPGDPAPCHTQPCVNRAVRPAVPPITWARDGTRTRTGHRAAWHADHTPSSQTEHCPAYTHMLNSHVHHLAHLPCPHATSLCEAVRTLALQSTLYRAAGREYSHPCTTVGEPSACKHPSLPSPRSPRRASARALRRPFWHPHAAR